MQFITYEQALSLIEQYTFHPKTESIPIDICTGRILGEDLLADNDMPPFDRVTMDGIAINHSSFEKGNRNFKIEKTVAAGAPKDKLIDINCCVEIMTGAIMPDGADTVIRYEDLKLNEGFAQILSEEVKYKQNIHLRGIDKKKGEILINQGKRLYAAEISIAAAIGKPEIKVMSLPQTAIISTGDELVDINQQPEPHQIRKSNVYGIRSMLNEWGIQNTMIHLKDDPALMEDVLNHTVHENDLLIITGGVSKGKFDYLPEVLEKIGVEKLFHKVQQRPGKPFWFGKTAHGNAVFALPGNPVSSFMCLYVYVAYWLNKSYGLKTGSTSAILAEDVDFTPDLQYFLQCKSHVNSEGSLMANPVIGNGSGDFANLVNADGFIILPKEKNYFKKGEVYPFIHYRK